MPEADTLEAPATTSAAPDPIARPIEGNEMPQGLRNLLDKVLPADGGLDDKPAAEAEPGANGSEPVEAKPEKPSEIKKPEPKTPDPASRLAPDVFEKKEEPAVVDEIPIPEEPPAYLKTEKAKEDHRNWRKKWEGVLAENTRLKAEKPAPTEDAGLKAMNEDLQRQNQDLLARIERVSLLDSPKFQRDLMAPRSNMFAEAKTVLKEAGVDPESLDHAMGLMGKAKIEALDAIAGEIPSQLLRDRFGRLVDGIDTKTREINEALKNAKGNREQMSRQEKLEQHAQIVEMEKQMKAGLQMTRRDLAENLKIELLHKTGKPEYAWFDKIVDDVDATAEEIMLRSTPEKLPTIAYFAALYGPTRDLFHVERKARLAAEERLAAIEGAEPTLGEDKRKPKDLDISEDTDIKDAVIKRLRAGS